MNPTYFEYVSHLAERKPDLRYLQRFLAQDTTKRWPESRSACIEYSKIGRSSCFLSSSAIEVLLAELDKEGESNVPPDGRVLLIEDVSPPLVEKLGSALDIDPLFFAGYLDTNFGDIDLNPPPLGAYILPSQIAKTDYVHLHFQRPAKLGRAPSRLSGIELHAEGNVRRKSPRLAPLKNVHIILIRSCCAVLRKKLKSGSWLCLVLVDATTKSIAIKPKSGFPSIPSPVPLEIVPQMPLFDAQCNLSNCHRPFSAFNSKHQHLSSTDNSLLHNLERSFQSDIPQIDLKSPTMVSLCYHPLRAILADWVIYSITMIRYVKHYEYSLQTLDIDFREQDLRELQVWRRRTFQTSKKLKLTKCFVEDWVIKEEQGGSTLGPELVKDIHYISTMISEQSHTLSMMIPVVSSMVQLLDTRRSLLEASSVRRLTYLAFVFVPLSFTTSLFSMAEKWGPGSNDFWVYFAVAVPLLGLTLVISWSLSGIFKVFERRKSRTTDV